MSLISVQITHHENKNQKYLDNCIRSLELQKGVDIEAWVIASTLEPPKVPDWVKVYRVDHSTPGPKAIVMGSSLVDDRAEHFFSVNDDAFLNEFALKNMLYWSERGLVVNPVSNCDAGVLWFTDLDKLIPGVKMKRFMRYEDLEGVEERIMRYIWRSERVAVPQQHLYMYATMFPMELWKKASYDLNYFSGYADTDLSFTYKKMGRQLVIAMDAFIIHYGGVTTHDMPNEKREKDKDYFFKKWNIQGG